ncbi:hypothetical protein [Sphingomonas bacterium]|uniref:hypothetical protein n=1 Tax=Sphingomonas bacterium TaxID=1895847 RepID=UPI0026199D78|nr:hypothetical protein [Sphingomonas bacterium]MDB5678760.1 hypothetical protein [Sphingomonas bacterium]
MIVLGSLMALSLVADSSRLDFQLMTSPAYDSFARAADARCPDRKLRYLHPADLGGIEEAFLPALPRRERSRIAAADTGFKGCPPAGMSCPAQHTLSAIVRAGMLNNFVRFACSAAN